MKKQMHRLLSLMLSLILVVGMIPATTIAASAETTAQFITQPYVAGMTEDGDMIIKWEDNVEQSKTIIKGKHAEYTSTSGSLDDEMIIDATSDELVLTLYYNDNAESIKSNPFKTFTISGQISGVSSSTQTTVTLHNPNNNELLRTTTVTGNGKYSFEYLGKGVYNGVYVIRASADGYFSHNYTTPQLSDNYTHDISFESRSYFLGGQITGVENNTVTTVELYQAGNLTPVATATVTGEEYYLIQATVGAGTYTIKATATDYKTYSANVTVGSELILAHNIKMEGIVKQLSGSAFYTSGVQVDEGVYVSHSGMINTIPVEKRNYQWQISDTGTSGWTDISGATTNPWTIPTDGNYGGKYIRVVVTADGYEGSVISEAARITELTISGGVSYTSGTNVGKKVTIGLSGKIAEISTDKRNYQWQISNNGTSGWSDINGATNNSYDIPADESYVGKYIRVIVTADGYSGKVVSTAKEITKQTNMTEVPDTPVLTKNAAGTEITISNYQADQEYVVSESSTPNWGTDTKFEGATLTGLTTNTTYYVHTRMAKTAEKEAGFVVRSANIRLAETIYLNGIELVAEKYVAESGEVVKITVNPVPGNATGFDGAKLYLNYGSGAKLYTDATCTTEIDYNSTYYTTVYLKGTDAETVTISAERSAGSGAPYMDNVKVEIAGSNGAFAFGANEIKLTPNSITIPQGGTAIVELSSMVTPEKPIATAEWASENGVNFGDGLKIEKIDGTTNQFLLTVSENCAIGDGWYNVTVNGTKQTNTLKVTVTATSIPVEGVSINPSAITLAPSGTFDLSAVITPANATNATVTWSSNNESVATVTNGKVTAVAEGTATITATVNGVSATCTVTVAIEHTCVVTPVAGKAATCTEAGYHNYYKCTCGKFYEDATASVEITNLDAWMTGDGRIAPEHNYGTLIDEVPATHYSYALKAGMKAHYVCDKCNTYFTEGKIATTKEALVIPAPSHEYNTVNGYKAADGHADTCSCGAHNTVVGHTPDIPAPTETQHQKCSVCGYVIAPALSHVHKNNLTKVPAETADCEKDGNIEYYTCSCGKWFSDATASVEITDKDSVKVAATGHEHGSEWKSDKDNHWNECACGDKANSAAHKDENSDGKCDVCQYNVGIPGGSTGDDKPSDNPQTGDNSNMILWISLLMISTLGIVATTIIGKKKYSVK